MTETIAPAATPRGYASASQWQLMWWAFRRHRLAMGGLIVTLLMYFIAAFAEFLAPADPLLTNAQATYHPPQWIHFIDTTEDGGWQFRPFVYAYEKERDPFTLKVTFQRSETDKIYLSFFTEGHAYKLWNRFPMNTHLLAPVDPTRTVFLMGADRLGRDVLSRTIYGARVSMSIGLVGVTLSLLLGVVLGGISGYYGGRLDIAIQRLVEFVLSLPTIPIWMALAAALPADWPALWTYFGITIIISLIGWTELARVVRGRFLALRTEDFVTAARLDGCKERRIIFRHMLPSMLSHIIASVTLAIPLMIIAETALSFLGLGLQPPTISWGVLLKEAQNVRSIATGPWLFTPGVAVVIAVLALNFLGDGLRDAADPYSQ